MDTTRQERSRGQNYRTRPETQPDLGDNTNDPVTLDQQIIDGLLEQGEIRLILQSRADGLPIQHPVCLGAGGPDGRAFASIEDAELDSSFVDGFCHGPAKRIYLLDQMTFSNTAN